MTTTVEAIYENGTLKLPAPLPLPEHSQVTVTIRSGATPYPEPEREAWLKLSEDQLTRTWANTGDDVFNELRDK